MGEFKGQLQVPGVVDWPLSVTIELEDERICIEAAGYTVGDWPLDEVNIVNRDQGFEVEAAGERFFVLTEDNREFALEVGMRRAMPLLFVGSDRSADESDDEGESDSEEDDDVPLAMVRDLGSALRFGRGRHSKPLFRRN